MNQRPDLVTDLPLGILNALEARDGETVSVSDRRLDPLRPRPGDVTGPGREGRGRDHARGQRHGDACRSAARARRPQIQGRRRSKLTIAEAPGRSTIEIESGKFALVVARERMRTGEVIEIRTPNAIAGVRGTVVITEVASVPSATTAQPPRVVSNFYVLRGSVEAQLLDPSTRAPIGAPRMINVLERFSVTGIGAGAVTPIRPEQVQPIHAGLQPKSYPPTMMGANRQAMTARAMQGAVVLATALAPPPSKPQTTNPGQQATPTEPAEPAALAGPTARAGSRAPPGPTAPLAALPALLASRAPFALLTRVTSLTPIIPRVVDTKTITGPPPKPPAPPK
jgi:hypothetical protein